MELVEGPTLADRIAQGPIGVADVLPIARQVADALEAAASDATGAWRRFDANGRQ
jgi:hypothetical protein